MTFQAPTQMYAESDRPQIHFTARRGWLNDPNGLVYHDGVYHLFFQHNPYGWDWGNMHWGHAASPDLVHWTEHPEALTPRQYGDWCFSGSAVVDTGNTSGFSTSGEDPLVLAYTSTGRGECIAYSNDRRPDLDRVRGQPGRQAQGPRPPAALVRACKTLGDGRLRRGSGSGDRLLHVAGPQELELHQPDRRLLRMPGPLLRCRSRINRARSNPGFSTALTAST